jgi:hypothetical protein
VVSIVCVPVLLGPISSITDPTFTVGGATVTVNGATVFSGSGDPKGLGDLHDGDSVTVTFQRLADGTLLALSITRN